MTSYKVVAIDVHKKMLAVVVADVGKDEWEFERRKFGTAPSELKALEEWLATREVCEALIGEPRSITLDGFDECR